MKAIRLLALSFIALGLLHTPLAYAGKTHVRAKTKDMIQLVQTNIASADCSQGQLRRLLPDGQANAGEYQVPDKFHLMITDVYWEVNDNASIIDDRSILGVVENAAGVNLVTSTTPVHNQTNAKIGWWEHFSSGVLVAPDSILCIDATIEAGVNTIALDVRNARIIGYLVK